MHTFRLALIAAALYMFCGLIVFQLFPSNLLDIFEASFDMKEIGISALRMISLSFLPASFGIMSTTVFQATAHGLFSLLASFIRQLVALLPIAWILMRLFGVELVWMAFPLAEIVGFVYSAFSLRYVYRKDIKNMTPEI